MDVQTTRFKLHPMDNSGSQGYRITVTDGEHVLTVRNRWENCGLIQEIVECSCGFVSTQHGDGGCWQYQHDKPRQHKLDDLHRQMYQETV